MNKLILFLFAIYPMCLLAELPHTFEANTPARASEVNANFRSLDDRIVQLETSTNTAPCTLSSGVVLDITHTPILTTVGEVFTFGPLPTAHGMVDIPFVELETRDKYIIRYPAPESSFENYNLVINTAKYTDTSERMCGTKLISGLPFEMRVTAENRNISIHYNSMFIAPELGFPGILPSVDMTSHIVYSIILRILVNKTIVTIVQKNVSDWQGGAEGPITDTMLSHDLMIPPEFNQNYYDDLIDYIEIKRVP